MHFFVHHRRLATISETFQCEEAKHPKRKSRTLLQGAVNKPDTVTGSSVKLHLQTHPHKSNPLSTIQTISGN